MSITKAIIPVAGWGTRRLPITKAIEKCMLPIGNRPIVDYVVQDCIKAGITDIYFVVGEQSQQIRTFYGENEALNAVLTEKSKTEALKLITPDSSVSYHFVTQPGTGKYGTAVPVSLCAEFIEPGESVVVLMGDDFIWNNDGSSEVKRLIDAAPEGECGLLAAQVAPEDVVKYGVIEADNEGNYVRIIEKPAPGEAPSSLVNISKYVLTKAVIDACTDLPVSPRGEYELPDAVNNFINAGGKVKVIPAEGEYLDGGTLEGWLHANNVVSGG